MGKIVLYIATSIDARIADANGDVGFLDTYTNKESDYGYAELIDRIGTVVMGSATYEKILGFSYWYEGKDHVVFSSRELQVPEGRSIKQVSGDPTVLANELRKKEKDSWLVGGAVLLDSFLERNLVDEMIITVVPAFLGAGTSLWVDGKAVTNSWHLAECLHWPNGVVQMHYTRP